jgi:hypothetical protein
VDEKDVGDVVVDACGEFGEGTEVFAAEGFEAYIWISDVEEELFLLFRIIGLVEGLEVVDDVFWA